MKLFVYGTLKRGHYNNYLLLDGGATFIKADKVPDHGVYGDWPIAGPAKGVNLEGEIWDNISPELWERLDRLESGYNKTQVFTKSGEKVMVYIYKHIQAMEWLPFTNIFPRWPA